MDYISQSQKELILNVEEQGFLKENITDKTDFSDFASEDMIQNLELQGEENKSLNDLSSAKKDISNDPNSLQKEKLSSYLNSQENKDDTLFQEDQVKERTTDKDKKKDGDQAVRKDGKKKHHKKEHQRGHKNGREQAIVKDYSYHKRMLISREDEVEIRHLQDRVTSNLREAEMFLDHAKQMPDQERYYDALFLSSFYKMKQDINGALESRNKSSIVFEKDVQERINHLSECARKILKKMLDDLEDEKRRPYANMQDALYLNEKRDVLSSLEQASRSKLILGEQGINILQNARVAVFGVGGVGGYVCEALVRCGVGNFDLIDNDTVSISNINRQIIATHKTVGRYKVDVMKERMLEINPDVKVTCHTCFFLPENADDFYFPSYDYVVDAVDTVSAKIALAVKCQEAEVPIISSMGAGNKLEASAFEVADIYKTSVCPLAKVMRRELKKRGVKQLKVVYSKEIPVSHQDEMKEPETKEPETKEPETKEPESLNQQLQEPEAQKLENREPATRKRAPGSLAFVPSAAGLIIAGEVVKDLTGQKGSF